MKNVSPPTNAVDCLLTEKQAAAFLNTSIRTLQGRRFNSQGPAYIKLGRAVRYLQKDLEAFLAGNRIDPEAVNNTINHRGGERDA